MQGVLAGLWVMWAVILVGVALARARLLGEAAQEVLTRLVYYVAAPCLLFSTLAETDIARVIGAPFVVAIVSGLGTALVYLALARFVLRARPPEAVIGAMGASLANAAYVGIPLAQYVLGSATHVIPVLVFQLGFLTPTFFVLTDLTTRSGAVSAGTVLRTVARNPLLIASLTGGAVGLTDLRLPDLVLEPISVVGHAAVPCILIAFGISLAEASVREMRSNVAAITLATVFKLVLQPVIAWAVARFAFGMVGFDLFAVTVMAGLPTAQNAYIAAFRAGGRAVGLGRSVIVTTTVLVTPTLMVIAALLA